MEFFACLVVSIDCRFITLFAIASCHDWMTLFRSRYIVLNIFPFFIMFIYFYCWIILNAWCEVSFLKSINHCALRWGARQTKTNDKEGRRRKSREKIQNTFHLKSYLYIVYIKDIFASTSWIEFVCVFVVLSFHLAEMMI